MSSALDMNDFLSFLPSITASDAADPPSTPSTPGDAVDVRRAGGDEYAVCSAPAPNGNVPSCDDCEYPTIGMLSLLALALAVLIAAALPPADYLPNRLESKAHRQRTMPTDFNSRKQGSLFGGNDFGFETQLLLLLYEGYASKKLSPLGTTLRGSSYPGLT
ncbi:hypothetical protein THAOC_34047, partial [Thalassiosira oceanica]